MSIRQDILNHLAKSENRAVERVVESALAMAEQSEAPALAEILLSRQQRAGMVALVKHFDRLSPEVRADLLKKPRELFGPMSQAIAEPEGMARQNVVGIIRQTGDPRLALLLTEALRDAREEVRRLAAETLLECVRALRQQLQAQAADELAGGGASGEDLQELRKAVESALKHFKMHKQEMVIVAALAFERQQDSQLWALFNDTHAEASRAAQTMLRELNDPDLAGAALLALASPLKPAAAAGISNANSPAVAAALTNQAFRLVDPVLRDAASGISHAAMLQGTYLPNENNWRGHLHLIKALGLPDHERLALLRPILELEMAGEEGRSAKALLLATLMEIPGLECGAMLAKLATDKNETIARTAARLLAARKGSDIKEHAAALVKSPHEAVRQLAAQWLAPGEFDKLWRNYQKMPPAIRNSSMRSAATDDTFPARLQSKLESVVPEEISQGLRMLASLPDLKAYQEHILRACSHGEPRIVSAAIRLIGRLEDPEFHDLLEAALQHPDARVRANAVESLDQLHLAAKSRQVMKLLESRHSRERANAIKAFSSFDFLTARECLIKMLNDPTPAHRISALWVVGQLEMLEVVRRMAVIARRDPHQKVRKIALEMLDQLQEAASVMVGR